MTDHTSLVDRYIAMWNEPDAKRRRGLIARTWTETGFYVDLVAGHQFRRTGDVETHNGRVR